MGAVVWIVILTTSSVLIEPSDVTGSGHSPAPVRRELAAPDPATPRWAGPTGSIGGIQVTLHNTMPTATGTYQQLLRINSSAFDSLINANWSNAYPYYTANGTPIYAWLEANASNTATDTLIWLRLDSLPANGWTNVSIAFWPKTSFNLSATGYLGEAPQLSANYGEFDNGARVFNFYDNFSGTGLSSQWGQSGTWVDTVSDGFHVSSVPGSGAYIASSSTFTYPAVVDFYGNLFQTTAATAFVGEGFGTSACTSCANADVVGINSQSSTQAGPTPFTEVGYAQTFGTAYLASQQFAVFTSLAISTNRADFELNYTDLQTLTSNLPVSAFPVGLAMSGNPAGSLTSTSTTLWIRERTFEASMPTATVQEFAFPVVFHETGLPSGTEWWVNVSGQPAVHSTNATLAINETDGTYSYSVATADKLYENPGGTFEATSPLSFVSVPFSLVTYPVTFRESGLPAGASWTIYLYGGEFRVAIGPTLTFNESNGTYSYSTSDSDPNYGSAPGYFRVSGAASTVDVAFSPLTYAILFTESGLPNGTAWSVTIGGVPSAPTTASILSVNVSNGTYSYGFASSDREYAAPAGSITVAGISEFLTVRFSEVTFPVTFTETGLLNGSRWWVNVTGGPSSSGTTDRITLDVPNGTFAFAASRPDLSFTAPAGSFDVQGAPESVAVDYQRVTFAVLFVAVGLPGSATWSVTLDGIERSGSGEMVFPNAVNGTHSFSVGALAGYTASPGRGSVVVNGMPVARVVTFAPPGGTFLGLPAIIGYSLVGGVLVIAVGLGILLLRRRKFRPTRSSLRSAPGPDRPPPSARRGSSVGPPKPRPGATPDSATAKDPYPPR